MEPKYLVSGALSVIVSVTLIWLIFIPHPSKYAGELNLAGVAGASPVDEEAGLFTSSQFGFSSYLPVGFTPNESYVNKSLGPDSYIPGVAFMVPQSLTYGTDLLPDSYISVESVGVRVECSPVSFMLTDDPGRGIDIGGKLYRRSRSVTSSAGETYEEVIYAREEQGKCIGIREFMHSAPGTARAFDRDAIDQTAERIAKTLVIR